MKFNTPILNVGHQYPFHFSYLKQNELLKFVLLPIAYPFSPKNVPV